MSHRNEIGGWQVYARERDSFWGGKIDVRKPYCLDCGGLPMLTAYVRKGAGGRKMWPIGYWCQFCRSYMSEERWILANEEISRAHISEVSEENSEEGEEVKVPKAYSYSFREYKAYPFLDYAEFRAKMLELRMAKRGEIRQLMEQSSDEGVRERLYGLIVLLSRMIDQQARRNERDGGQT